MKPFLIIDTLQKLAYTGAGVLKIAVFVAVNLLVFQGFRLFRRCPCVDLSVADIPVVRQNVKIPRWPKLRMGFI